MEGCIGKCVARSVGSGLFGGQYRVQNLSGRLFHDLEIALFDVVNGRGSLVDREASVTEGRIVESRQFELEFGIFNSCENTVDNA